MSKNSNKQSYTLESLFNSKLRVKVLKFLFRNCSVDTGPRDLAKRIQESLEAVRKEMINLERIGLIVKSKM